MSIEVATVPMVTGARAGGHRLTGFVNRRPGDWRPGPTGTAPPPYGQTISTVTTTRTTLHRLAGIPGARRYALSATVEAATSGVLRPFLVLYAVTTGLSAPTAGVLLTVGMLAGLGAIPLAGRWIDTGARRGPASAALLARAAGALVLVLLPGSAGFAAAAVLVGVGTQTAAPANAALIAALTEPGQRPAALATIRSLRNAGLGTGALFATLVVAGGPGALRWLALVTAAGCALGAVLVAGMPLQHRATGPAMTADGQVAAVGPTATGDGRVASGRSAAAWDGRVVADGRLRMVTILAVAGIPFAFYADILEIALPLLLVQDLRAAPAWSSGIFVGNTVLVIALQVVVTVRLARRPHGYVLAASGVLLAASYLGFWLGAAAGGGTGTLIVALVAVPYTMGEILYTGSAEPLVIALAPAHLLGRSLARWQLSYGLARAVDPMIITALLTVGAAALWVPLAVATLAGAAVVALATRSDAAAAVIGSEQSRR
jgi:hypothetical protein